jgi:hypothetical protein
MHGWGGIRELAHRGINKDRLDVYSHVETSGARWGAFFGFSRPTSHLVPIFSDFCQQLILANCWST